MLKRINVYDVLIVMLLLLMAAGGLGRGFQPARVLTICVFPVAIFAAFKSKKDLETYAYEGLFFFVWVAWAVLSLRVARDLTESVKQCIYLIVHITFFFELILFATLAKRPVESILAGWIGMIVLTIPIALFEFITDIHLPISVQESGEIMNFGYTQMERRFASVTFGNLNAYNQVICFCLPFVLYTILYAREQWKRLFCIAVLALLASIILRNASRGAMLCLFASGLLFAYYYSRSGHHRIMLFVAACVAVLVGIFVLASQFEFLAERLTSQGGHDSGRWENIVVGLQALADSYLFGIGVGNYSIVLGNEYGIAIPAPHNLLLEIIVIYGVVIFIGFMLMFVHAFHISQRGGRETLRFYMLMIACLATSFFIDSGHLAKVPTWAFLASLFVGSNSLYNSFAHPFIPTQA